MQLTHYHENTSGANYFIDKSNVFALVEHDCILSY